MGGIAVSILNPLMDLEVTVIVKMEPVKMIATQMVVWKTLVSVKALKKKSNWLSWRKRIGKDAS